MESRVRQNLIRLGVKKGDRVAAAVSGGVDSMALLHCLFELSREMGITVTACHMEHGIRGKSSENDMEFVKSECERLGIPCVVRRADAPALAKKEGISVETAARRLRYEFLDECEADFIVMAHHMDDMAETVIMNLARGSGLAGLCGIPEARGRYIRPMLDISRREIEEYVRERGITHVHDETNDNTSYTRNYVRKEIIPRLARVNEAAIANIARSARLLSEDEEALVWAAQGCGCIEEKEDGSYIDLEKFSSLKAAVKKRVIRLAVSRWRPLEDMENVHVQSVLELAEKAEAGKRLDIGRGTFAAVIYDKLMIGNNSEKRYNNNSVTLRPGRFDFAGFAFECEEQCGETVFCREAEYFDAGAVRGVVFRHRMEGDHISPLGLGGTKRLCDYLSDRKVPLHLRDGLVVMASGSEVFWVVGVGVSEKSKISGGRAAIKIRYWEKWHA